MNPLEINEIRHHIILYLSIKDIIRLLSINKTISQQLKEYLFKIIYERDYWNITLEFHYSFYHIIIIMIV